MAEPTAPLVKLIRSWLTSRLDGAALAWIDDRTKVIASGDRKALFLSFGLVPRKVGKGDLTLSEPECNAAIAAVPDWNPDGWSIDQLVRSLFVLSYPSNDRAAYVETLDKMFSTGEVGEQVALYQALPLLPNPEDHVLRAAEGIRTNIKAIFCAVAHRNPFPAEHFNEDQWNQMILKCLFIGVSLRPVISVDERANERLMSMLIDFAHERRAAHRSIPAELWRCVGPFADDRAIADLKLVLTTGTAAERQAAALALSTSHHSAARSVLAEAPEQAQAINAGEYSWRTVAATEQAN